MPEGTAAPAKGRSWRGLAAGIIRAVRPGGRVAAAVWDYREGMEFLRRFWDAAVRLDPLARDLDEGTRFPLCRPEPLRERFAGAGLEQVVVEAVEMANGEVVMTDPDLPSGSDRIAAALNTIDPGGVHKFVINLQGDLPTIDPGAITACLDALKTTEADISTLAAPITDAEELANPNVVKALARFNKNETVSLASDFARTLPSTWDGPHLHHIGIYAYRRHALERFVSLPVSKREAEHKLEQLRALDNGMKIAVALVDTVPFGVDTPADLDRARALLAPRQSVTE